MRLFITGGLGHIGTGFLAKTRDLKFKEIIVIDNLISKKINLIFNLNSQLPIKFIDQNIIDYDLKKNLKNNDVIIHLAAITNAAESFKIKKEIFKNNFLSTKIVVDACKEIKARCVFVSSTSVYGSNDSVMFEDDKDNLNPQSPYAECKIKEENYIKKNAKNSKSKFVILRFGTIFGVSKGMRFHTAVNKFCYQTSFNNPLTVWKTAYNQQRPYLDLNDAIKCIKFIIKKNIFDNQIYNVVTINLSIKELLDYIKKYKKINIKYVSNRIMNQLSYRASNLKISRLGFKFSGNIDKQIKKTLELFKIKK
jgi:UDP-glucose 4-epimerase